MISLSRNADEGSLRSLPNYVSPMTVQGPQQWHIGWCGIPIDIVRKLEAKVIRGELVDHIAEKEPLGRTRQEVKNLTIEPCASPAIHFADPIDLRRQWVR